MGRQPLYDTKTQTSFTNHHPHTANTVRLNNLYQVVLPETDNITCGSLLGFDPTLCGHVILLHVSGLTPSKHFVLLPVS